MLGLRFTVPRCGGTHLLISTVTYSQNGLIAPNSTRLCTGTAFALFNAIQAMPARV